jgi:hypothetical protein
MGTSEKIFRVQPWGAAAWPGGPPGSATEFKNSWISTKKAYFDWSSHGDS